MKKIIITIIMCLNIALLFAQAPERKSVVLDYFGKSPKVSTADRDMIREAVITTLTNCGRLSLLDATNIKALKISESAAKQDKAPSVDNIRQIAMKESGGKYLITGNVSSVDANKEQKKDESIFYTGVIVFSLIIIDLETGNNIGVEEISFIGERPKCKSKEEAIKETMKRVPASLNRFINENFKIETKIVQIHEEKNGKVTQVYINVGSALGIDKNQTFLMYIDSEVAGVKKREEIGRLTVESIYGDELTLCKVSKPTALIKEHINSGSDIIVITDRAKSGLFNSSGK